MNPRPSIASRLALALALSAGAATSQADVFKCVNEKGESVFQQEPCLANTPAKATSTDIFRPLRVQLLVVGSNADIETWLAMPEKARKPGSERLRQVHRGQLLLVPIVVTNFVASSKGTVAISAEFQLISPTGTVAYSKQFEVNGVPDKRTPGLMVLNPIMNVTSEATDSLGWYIARVKVTNGAGTAQAEERFELVR